MNKPLVSVIIPTFNRAYTILNAIESVHKQTYDNIEIIVIDDGSTDNTQELLKHLDTLRYFKLKTNQGQSNARNVGLSHTKGEFICTLDSDDVWLPEFVENALRHSVNYNLDLFFSNWKREITPSHNLLNDYNYTFLEQETEPDTYIFKDKDIKPYLLDHCIFPSSSMMIRKSSLQKAWDDNIKVCDDWDFIINLLLGGHLKNIGCTPKAYWIKYANNDNVCDSRADLEFLNKIEGDYKLMFEKYSSNFTPKNTESFNTLLTEVKIRKTYTLLKNKPLKGIDSFFTKDLLSLHYYKVVLDNFSRIFNKKMKKWFQIAS